jgi:hypothetical protein
MMGKLDTVKLVVDIANTIHSAAIALSDAKARREKERREREDEAKDKRIKELEAQLAAKGTTT